MWYVSYCTARIAICIVFVDSRIIPALGQTAEKAVWLGSTVFTILSSSFGCITVRVPCHTDQILESLQQFSLNVPCHEITARFVLCKLQMRNHPVGLDVWFLVGPFVYFHTLCVQAAKALARLCGWGLPEPSLDAYVTSTIISRAGSNNFFFTISYASCLVHIFASVLRYCMCSVLIPCITTTVKLSQRSFSSSMICRNVSSSVARWEWSPAWNNYV